MKVSDTTEGAVAPSSWLMWLSIRIDVDITNFTLIIHILEESSMVPVRQTQSLVTLQAITLCILSHLPSVTDLYSFNTTTHSCFWFPFITLWFVTIHFAQHGEKKAPTFCHQTSWNSSQTVLHIDCWLVSGSSSLTLALRHIGFVNYVMKWNRGSCWCSGEAASLDHTQCT